MDISLNSIGNAQAELATALARLVDAGSVPAARELRAVLADLDLIQDEEMAGFLTAIRTPGL